MSNTSPTIGEIQESIRSRNYHFTLHAIDRITQRHITGDDVMVALLSDQAEIIENYPNDPRGPSCLILGFGVHETPMHVQCSYPPSVVIVTAYEPRPEEWRNWRERT